MEQKCERARRALESKLPEDVLEDISDEDLENLGRSGFTSAYALAAANERVLEGLLPGRPGLVLSILKAFGEPTGPRKDPMVKILQDIGEIESLPNVDELGSFLRRNPLQSRFPISVEYFTRLCEVDTAGLFKIEDRDHLCKKLDSGLANVLDPPSTSTTESSFHQLWDNLIKNFVQLFCKQTIYWDRDTSHDASTDKLRPDVIGVLGSQWALWRAEEKAPSTLGNPRTELIEKLSWFYGDLPYILAYHARGTLVTFTALYMGQGSKRVKDLWTFDLSTIEGRVDIVLACLNVARLLPRLSSLCLDECVEAEFLVLPDKGNEKQVKLYGSSVKKSFRSRITFDRVLQINQHIRGCPHIEQVVRSSSKDTAKSNWHSIVFQPRCSTHQRARPESELVKALVNVAEALVWLHERSFMHRDIRWSNIAKFTEEWFLLDFDECCVSSESQGHESLCPESHAPETPRGRHDCAVDIWGIGHLIQTSKVGGLTAKLIQLQDLCLNSTPTCRPPAQYCLQELRSLVL